MTKNLDESYKKQIKSLRKSAFSSSYDWIYGVFEYLGYHQKSQEYFLENASDIVNKMREVSWERYLEKEAEFNSSFAQKLAEDQSIQGDNPEEFLVNFFARYNNEIYDLMSSNTNSRRSRAGKEFEIIIELIMMGAGIPFGSQASLSSSSVNDVLNKSVDFVVPNIQQFEINKRSSFLISCKTTFRERWQQVPEEVGRVKAGEAFLLTLDNKISEKVFDILYQNNVYVVTTKDIIEENYSSKNRVISLEKMLQELHAKRGEWEGADYSSEQVQQITRELVKQMAKHDEHPFVSDYYAGLISLFT